MKVEAWAATGGKTQASFFKSHDEKYVFKEVNKAEYEMLAQFGPTYFKYMAKVMLDGYHCALAKILGAFVVSVNTQHQPP